MENYDTKEARRLLYAFCDYLGSPIIRSEREKARRVCIHKLKIVFHDLKNCSDSQKKIVLSFLGKLPVSDEDRQTFIDLYVRGYSKKKICDYPVYEKEIDRRVDRVFDEIGRILFTGYIWDYPGLDVFLNGYLMQWDKK